LPTDPASDVIVRQLVRSGTGESAHYRAARRGRSRAEFMAKLAVAAEEADETEHWLTVITDSHLVTPRAMLQELEWLLDEAKPLRAIRSED
jgi:four helix bundle protein